MMEIFYLLFMTPLCIFNKFWMVKNLVVILSFMYFFKLGFLNYSYISYFMGWDFLSYFLILLSFWILFLMFKASLKILKLSDFSELFSFMLLILMIFLFITFSSMNMIIFYTFFEASMIPVLILIMGWGYQPERIQAGMYMFFYTIIGSLPMLLFIFIFNFQFFSFNMNFFLFSYLNVYLYMMMLLVFLIKLPMFLFHLWLPKAHVEASVSGSMILAGVMLKLGGYGLMRFMSLFLHVGMKFNFLIINLSLMGGVIVSLICLRQSDMKSLIAYSSVVHMGLMLGGLMTLNYWGIMGSLIMMLAHGLCSSGLFALVNINYERFLSRSIYINKGMLNLIPYFSLCWFMLVISNMAAPPSMNLLGEIFLINSLINYSLFSMYMLMLISFFSAVYCLYLYSFSQHGIFYSGAYSLSLVSLREILLLLLHWLPLNLLFLKGDIFMF